MRERRPFSFSPLFYVSCISLSESVTLAPPRPTFADAGGGLAEWCICSWGWILASDTAQCWPVARVSQTTSSHFRIAVVTFATTLIDHLLAATTCLNPFRRGA